MKTSLSLFCWQYVFFVRATTQATWNENIQQHPQSIQSFTCSTTWTLCKTLLIRNEQTSSALRDYFGSSPVRICLCFFNFF